MLKKSLISLAFGSFAIGMTEFTMMGILPDIAGDLQIDIPTAGHLIALYALGVVVGAPLLVMIASKYPSKKVLIALMLMFTVFNGLFAFAPEQNSLMILRFLSGLPHGAFFGVGSVVAARIAEKGKEARAISIMFTGMTIANLAGVPLGTYVGHHFSWRISYAVIALFGLATAAAVKFWLPTIKSEINVSLKQQLQFFKTGKAWL
ncbi:MFS transporter, partial [Pseudoxanthomonas sp. SGD-10]